MRVIIFFIGILFIIKITKLHTNLSLLLALLITYFVFYNETIKNQIKNITNPFNKTNNSLNITSNIPDIITKDWYLYWKDYLKDLKEYNIENIHDVLKSLKHFQQIYLGIINGINLSNQHLDNLSLLEKEILNLLQSTIFTLPTTVNQTLEKHLNEKVANVKKELDFRLDEIRNFVNKDWDSGLINVNSKPFYKNELSTLEYNYSPHYNYF